MTILEAKQKLSNWCLSQVGYHESWDGTNKYGADSDWDTRLYGFDAANVPWCDWFVDYAFIFNFGYDLGVALTYQTAEGSALCRRSAEFYKNNGAWFSFPEQGDQIFFYYDGEINHTGIVVSVDDNKITCVEGNYSDGVCRTYYNWKISNQIAGYGRPNWRLVVQNDETKDPDTLPEINETESKDLKRSYLLLRYGDGVNSPLPSVKAWQNLLLCWGFSLAPYGADGEFGSLTQNATIQFQQKVGITPDGIVGEQSWKQAIYIG